MAGRPAEALRKLGWQDVIHPGDLQPAARAVASALDDTGELDVEVRLRRPDGGEPWLRVTGKALDGGGDNPARLVVHYEDVTARRAGEEAVALLVAVVASVADAVITTDPEGRIRFLNAAAERLYGLRSADVEGQPAGVMIVDPGSLEEMLEWRRQLMEGTFQSGSRISRHRRADGTVFDAEVSSSAVRDDHGTLLGMASVIRDVTARLAQEESAATLRAVVDSAAEAIVGVDERDVIRFFSPSAERLFGWSAEEVVGGPVWVLPADHRQMQARDLRDALRTGRTVQRETVVRRKGGSHVAAYVTASPITDAQGRYRGAAITLLDVSDRRQAEREAERSRELLQRLIDNAPNVISFKDREGVCWLVNRLGAEIFERAPEEILGHTDADILPPELAARNRAEDLEVMATGRPMTFFKQIPHGDGVLRPYVTTKFPILEPDGEAVGVGVISSDVSAIRRGEADSARLAAVVQAAPDAIVTKDRDGLITTWNPGAERMFGVRADEALGRRYEEVVVPKSEWARYHELRGRVFAGETVAVRMDGQRDGGSVFPIQVSAAPLTAPDGTPDGIVAIVRDMTDLVDAEVELRRRAAQLERSNVDLEIFAYAASHDLQEPLRSIKMGAETVARSATERLDEDERALLDHVGAAATRMSAQVYALMELARVALGQGPDEPAALELALDDALNALRAAIRDTDAAIDVRAPLPQVAVPRAEVALVLQNLMSNAIKFRRPGERPQVEVSAKLAGDFIEVRVVDQGVGLSEAESTRIFGIFERLGSGVPGTGLGLTVCRRILERRGGSISVASAGRDRGSEFTVRLPRVGA
jgi:PAS domain S-box-containing protein